jgi:EAL domain-containing protein (putative c-di-GMP-specific phosphodiesterase class I)
MIDHSGRIIYPGAFINQILYTKLYRDITRRVLQLVFKTIAKKRVTVSINLNLSDLQDSVIYRLIIEELYRHKELARWLVIELLEYETSDDNTLKERINAIREYGTRIAVYDFGSGYANFSLFQNFPIDILKIDGSLVKEIASSDVAFTITETIHHFAKKLNIVTVAEFIHDEKTYQIVKELGIEEGQGFYLAKPAAEVEETKGVKA